MKKIPFDYLPAAESITHQHLLSVINTILSKDGGARTVRILDAGCGNGKLIAYLHVCLHRLYPEKDFEISGYDVTDHGVQSDGFISNAIGKLNSLIGNVDWASRIHSIRADDKWKFSLEPYDFIISNQVLEHVKDKNLFFSNINANLADGGHSIHLAPLSHVIYEGHLYLPLAHRFRNYSALYSYIRIMSRLGFGKFRQHRTESGCSLHEYSQRHADYMFFWTNYSTEAETLEVARKNGLRCDFRYTVGFFTSKLRQLFRIKPRLSYSYRDGGFVDAISIKIYRYLSSVTLVCKKSNTY